MFSTLIDEITGVFEKTTVGCRTNRVLYVQRQEAPLNAVQTMIEVLHNGGESILQQKLKASWNRGMTRIIITMLICIIRSMRLSSELGPFLSSSPFRVFERLEFDRVQYYIDGIVHVSSSNCTVSEERERDREKINFFS